MLLFMQLLQPTTAEEAYALMTKHKMAPVLAGGCWLRLGKRRWPMVIDLSGAGLRYIREEEQFFAIGAMTTQREVEMYEPFQQLWNGILSKAVTPILGVQFRNMATIGGSVSSRYGFSDIIPTLCALHATVVLHHAGEMSIQEYLTFKERDLLVEVRIPKQDVKVAAEALRKSVSDFPHLTGSIRRDGRTYEVYVGCRPGGAVLAAKASSILSEEGLAGVEKAAEALVEEVTFQTNSHSSESYRKAMAKKMVVRLAKEVE